MLNTKRKHDFGSDDSGGNWKDNSVIKSHVKSIIDNFLLQIVKGANELLGLTDDQHEYTTMIPGFVETVKPMNQLLHLDSKKVIHDDPYHTLIIHIPLSVEGMWLRLAQIKMKDNNKKLNHGMIHIPFGSGIVLPCTQYHAGHFGSKGNFCFHAVISSSNWHGTSLEFINGTVTDEFGDQADEVMKNLENELYLCDVEEEMKEAREKNCTKQQKNYVNDSSKMYIDGAFHVFLNDTHVAYF